MGYELNKLMKQHGVYTPGVVAYSGAAKPVAPTAPAELAKDATDEQRTAYNDLLAKYNADKAKYETSLPDLMKKYEADRAAYDQYRQDYLSRVGGTPQYLDSQYDTSRGASVPAAVTYSAAQKSALGPGGIGLDAMNRNVQNWFAANPNATREQVAAAQQQWGVSDQDIRNAMGSGFKYGEGFSGYGSPGFNYATSPGQIGADKYNANIRDWLAANKGATTADIEAQQRAYGISNRDIYGATGNYWGNYLGAPTYSSPYVGQNTPTPPAPQPPAPTVPPPDFSNDPGARVGPQPPKEYRLADMDQWGRSRWSNDFGKPPTGTETIKLSHGGSVHGMAQKYQVGGAVRRFQVGGNRGELDTREDMPMPAVEAAPGPLSSPAAQPLAPAPASTTPVSPAAGDLMSMLQRYGVGESVYAPELKAARARSDAETKAFTDMIQNAMKGRSYAPDKTEMYFRLASAFGAPTRTGHFAENLSMVGKELGEYAKESRTAKKAEEAMRLQLAMEAQKIKAQGAREELTGLRTLVGEEMKDKRALLQEYIKSGRPQSEAGKAAVDAGLQQGTPEFTDFVNKYIDDKIRSGNMLKEAMVLIAAGQLELGRTKERRAEESGKKLTPAEVKLKSEAETTIGGLDDSMASLKRAYSLNPNTFDGTLASIAQRKLLEQTDPKDPRVLATREQANLLSKGAIDKLRASFGGNPTEGERAALLQLEGLDSKSKEERAMIMKNTYKLLQARRAREQKRLNDISAGLYRETTPSAGEIE